MEKLILIGGQAGLGTDRTSLLLAQALTSLGFYVFTYRDYPSVIRGSHNFSVLKVSDQPVYSHENFYDVIIALDQKTIDLHQKELKKNGFILGKKGLRAKNFIALDLQSVLEELKAPKIVGNNVLLGALFKVLNLPLNALNQVLEQEFGQKAALLKKTVQFGYQQIKESRIKMRVRGNPKCFFTGSQGIVSGAMTAGIDVYLGYPMTPATPVLHLLAAQQEKEKIFVFQPENELSVINMALGASYAGAMAMVGTSGGGFALMSEAMSLSGMAEIPLVVYLSQRPAPATGVPTYTAQGDLKFCVNVGHGEFPKVVIAPGDSQEAILRTTEAFYLSYQYQVLTILIGDKHLAESGFTFDELEKPKVKPSRFIIKNPKDDYQRYLITKDGVSARAVPGQGPVVRATSYEHDEDGHTTEDAKMIVKMNDKRWKKLEFLKKETSQLHPVNLYGQGKNLLVSWGSTKGAILDALKNLDDFRFMQVSYLTPFPREKVQKEIENSKNVILIENNVTGLLGQIIREETGQLIEKKLLKYDARPFTSQEIIKGVKGTVK